MYICIYIYTYTYIYIYIYIYIYMTITKKSPLSILNHLRVINLACLKQRFDDCPFQVSFYLYNFFLVFTIYFIKVHAYYTLQLSLEAS